MTNVIHKLLGITLVIIQFHSKFHGHYNINLSIKFEVYPLYVVDFSDATALV
jgi:hypothetical protein